MEQTLIFSGLIYFPGWIVRRGSLDGIYNSWEFSESVLGISPFERLFPRKPKQPI
jgi:hypothetical protein